jgi:signal transduction histidine kinase
MTTIGTGSPRSLPVVNVIVKQSRDWLGARQRAQIIAEGLGFTGQDQTRIATAVSEIARNAYEYAGGGRVEFVAETGANQSMMVRISDEGPGIEELDVILAGRYRSPHGLGIGITGSRMLMDEFHIDTRIGKGTSVELRKFLPKSAPPVTSVVMARVSEALGRRPADPLEEAQHYNQDLLRALDELGRVNHQLKAANESKDLFLAMVSHEMRTPMTAILGWLQLLESPSVDEETRVDGMNAIRSAARVQARLVDDVLDAARAHTGKLHLRIEDVDMRHVIDSMWDAIGPAASAKSLNLSRSLGDESLFIRGDVTRLQQIIWNLVSNAIKFTPENGAISVCASADEASVSIRVTDSGEGIAEDLLPHVFEQFRQGADARKHGGLGLGLSIVQQIVELHGGKITATSEGVGQGACFTVSFPVLAAKA